MQIFKIHFPIDIKRDDEFSEIELLDDELPKVVSALYQFSTEYWPSNGVFTLGKISCEFDAGDIKYFWAELPSLLQSCVELKEAVAIFLPAQWRRVSIVVEPSSHEDYVLVSILTDTDDFGTDARSPQRWEEALALQRATVSKQQFVEEWKKFARSVVELLIEKRFVDVNDPSISEYLKQLPDQSL